MRAISLGVALVVVGCASDASVPPKIPTRATDPAPAESQSAPVEDKFPDKDPARGKLEISNKILKACGLSHADAYFAYNSAAVSGQADKVLRSIAECFKSGPLKGAPMKLIGHADPRGDEEYNMLLGQRRADNVQRSLVRLGMPTEQITTTSRGEMDATGTDEESWTKDRRVQMETD